MLARSFRAASFPERTGRGSGRTASPNGTGCPRDTADSSNGRRLPERIGAHGSGSIPGTSLAHTHTLCRRWVRARKTSAPSSFIVMRPMLVVLYPMRDVQRRDNAVVARTMKSRHLGCPVFHPKSGPLLLRRLKRGSRFLNVSRVAGSRHRCLAVPTTAREFSSFVAIGRRFLRRSLARRLLR